MKGKSRSNGVEDVDEMEKVEEVEEVSGSATITVQNAQDKHWSVMSEHPVTHHWWLLPAQQWTDQTQGEPTRAILVPPPPCMC
jgi:hypothetical protein